MGSYAEYKKRKAQVAQTTDEAARQKKSAYQQYKERKRAANSGYSADSDYQSLLTDYETFATAAQTDSKNVGYGNAKGYLTGRSDTAKALKDRANKLAVYLHSNQDVLDTDAYKSAIANIESMEREIDRTMDYFGDRARYFSQWATEDDYNAFVSEQKAYEDQLNLDTDAAAKELAQMEKDLQAYQALRFAAQSQFSPDAEDAQALTDLQKKYGDVEDLNALITQKRQYLEQAQSTQSFAAKNKEYSLLRSAGDFEEMSKYVPQERQERRMLDVMMDNYSDEASGWDDPLYEYVNGNQDAGAYLSNQAAENYGGQGLAAIFGRASDSKVESQQMTKDEVATFNYLYATQGKDAAHSYYYDHLQSELNARQREHDAKYWANYAEEDPFGASVFSVVTSPLKGLSYAGQAADYIAGGKIDQNAGYNRFSYVNSAVRNQVAQQIENSGKWGKAGSFLYQTGMSMGEFVMGTAVSGGNQTLALAIMGTGAAADTTIAAKDRGLTDGQAFALGTIAGAAEVLMEKVSLDKLFDADMLADGAVKYVLYNALAEGSEEIGTDLINTIADVLIAQDKSEWQIAIDAYMAEGKSESEAFGLALGDKALELGLSGFGGALSGGVMSGTGALVNHVQGNAQSKKLYGTSQQELVAEALEIDPENAFAKKMQSRLEGGKNLSGSQLNKLVQQNEVSIKKQGTSTENTVATDTAATRQIATETGVKTPQPIKADNRTTSKANATENVYGASEDGKTCFKGEAVSILGVASVKDSTMKLKLEDGRTVDAKDVEYASADEAVVYETVAGLGVHALGANMLIENYNPSGKVAATVYAKGVEEAYSMGQLSVPQAEVAAMPFASQLEPYQRQAAYQLGELFGGKQTAKEQATVRKNRTVSNADTSKGKVHFEGDRNSLNITQKASLDAMEVLSKALGVQIYVFESEADANGKRRGANGWYDPSDGSIHIDLYAGNDGKGTMLFTVAHELTHFIRQWSPAKFKVLANFLMKQYSHQGVSVNELVQSQMEKARRSGRELSYEQAHEEVVADSMESVLSDGSVIEMMAELKQQDHGLWAKIKEWFRDFADKLRAIVDAYKGVAPDSPEGRMVADMQDMIGTLQALYMDALVDASENFDGGTQKNTTAESGGVKYSMRSINIDRMFIDYGNTVAKQVAIDRTVAGLVDRGKVVKIKADKVKKNGINSELNDRKAARQYLKGILEKFIGDSVYFTHNNQYAEAYLTRAGVDHSVGGAITAERVEIFDHFKQLVKNAEYAFSSKNDVHSNSNKKVSGRIDWDCFVAVATIGKDAYPVVFKIRTIDRDVRSQIYEMATKNKANGSHDPGQQNNPLGEMSAYGVVPSTSGDKVPQNTREVKKYSDRNIVHTTSDVQKMKDDLSNVTAEWQAAEERYNTLVNDPALIAAERRLEEMRSSGESRFAVVRSPEYKAARAERDAIKERLGVDAARDAAFDLRERERKLQAEIQAEEEAGKAKAGRKAELESVKKSGMSEADYFRDRAAKRFGYTQEFKYAGYLLPDGKLLDFTSEEGKRDGKRDKDHREIGDIYEYTHQSAALLRFLNDGNIRIMAETPGIDLTVTHEPTSQQYAEIKRFVREYADKRQFMVDISGADGRIVGTYTYDGRISADRVVSDIQYYFQNGKLREQSPVAGFHYSMRDGDRQAVVDALEKENGKLREDVTYLKELLKLQRSVTGGTKFTKNSVEGMAQNLKSYANAKGDTKELAKLLNGLYEYIAGNKELTWEGVKEQAQGAVDWLWEHIDRKAKHSEYAQDILKQIHGSRVYLDESQMAEVEYRFGSYSDYRKSLFGNITIAKDADTSLDSLWQEMAKLYPDVFNKETTSTDMPGALVDIIHRLRNPDTTVDYARNREMMEQDLFQQVYDSYWRVSTLYTVADVKQRQINRLKGEHFQRMNKLKEQHRENVAQLKQAHEERLKKVREDYRNRMDTKVDKITKQYQESRKKGIEGRRKTKMRHKIQKVVKKLNDLLLNESKDRHVPDSLKKAVAEALDAVNMDTVGADERIAKYDDLIAKATDPDVIASLSETRDRIAKSGERLADRIGKLKAAYDSIKTGADSASISVYDEVIANKIQEVVELVGDTALRDMTYEQLDAVYEMYTMIAKSISNANKSFKEARGATITQMGDSAIREVKATGGSNQYAVKALENTKKFGWDMLKPYYAFSLIGSDTLSRLYDNVRKGEDVWAVDVSQARTFFREQAQKHGYDRWDMSKEYAFQDVSGREFKVSLQQIMSLYAYSKRAQADKHLEKGGFVFDSAVEVMQKKGGIPVKYRVNTANAYNLNRMQINEIVNTLTEDQIAFVDAMQEYLSTVMGEKGNEVSLALYDVRLFKEKNYFPLKSASQYTSQQSENTGEVKLKNSGFSKKTVVNASNPIILSDFMSVWGSHVNDMSMYHAFVLPLEDFNRVYNYKTLTSEDTSTQSVKAALQNAYGIASTKYIKQMLEDINGGARSDDRASIISRWMGKFKKGSVFANASVVIQQPSAIARAAALINLQYFIGPKISQKRHKQLWEEVKQYAPVAIIKEMGYFDTNMGLSTTEFLTAKEYGTIGEKAKAIFTDGNYRDEMLSRPAALADEISWCYIWEAVKRETREKNPNMDIRSEAFLKKAGERFTEVVTRTQVYDSVLSRSGLMRSKDTGAKMMTAFMSEPTTSMNMVIDALVQGKRGNRWYTRNAIGAVVASQILNALLVSFVYAARDDDDDKSYWEKYLANFIAKTLDGLNPLTYLPFIKDIVSITRGYTVERSDMSVISDIWAAWQKLPNEKVSLYRKIEDFGGSIAQAFGVPLKNIMRDIRAIVQTSNSFLNGPETTGMGIGAAIMEEVTGKDIPKHRQLYDAIVQGDARYKDRIAGEYADEAALESAIRKGLREFDARISEAAEARYYGDFAEYERIFKEIEEEGHFTRSQIAGAIRAEINSLDDSGSVSSAPKQYGMYSIDDFMLAVCTDNAEMSESIKTEILRFTQENGKSEEQAKDSFINSAVSACKEQYLSGKITKQQANDVMIEHCGRTENEAEADISYWKYKQDNPNAEVSAQWFDTYYEKLQGAGIELDTYVEYRIQKSGYTKKADIMRIIDVMALTDKQKDTLYFAEGWAESTLDEAPWHQ